MSTLGVLFSSTHLISDPSVRTNISSPSLEDVIVEMRWHESDSGSQAGQMGSSWGQVELSGHKKVVLLLLFCFILFACFLNFEFECLQRGMHLSMPAEPTPSHSLLLSSP